MASGCVTKYHEQHVDYLITMCLLDSYLGTVLFIVAVDVFSCRYTPQGRSGPETGRT